MKKVTLFVFAVILSVSAFSQQPQVQPSRPVHLDGKDVDSTKNRLQNLSIYINSIPELTQGKAKELQQILVDIFNTILRNEERPKELPAKEKPKQ